MITGKLIKKDGQVDGPLIFDQQKDVKIRIKPKQTNYFSKVKATKFGRAAFSCSAVQPPFDINIVDFVFFYNFRSSMLEDYMVY